jgi:ABC-type Fe3+ transport system permease subunit
LQWDVAVGRAVLHTLVVSLATGVVASLLGTVLAIALGMVRTVGQRWCAAALFCMVLVPVYVQATAWSAGFGIQGWFRLSQVDAAKHPWWGIASVVWIHAAAAVPSCFLIVSIGLQRVLDAAFQQALLEGGWAFAVRNVALRRMMPWFAAAMLWTVCMTQNDMVVTNLFQVPTLCESVYQQVQFGKLRSLPILMAIAIALVTGWTIATMAWLGKAQRASQGRGPGQASMPMSHAAELVPSGGRVLASVVSWAIVGVVALLPWLSLLVRAGWRSLAMDGQFRREWSIAEVGSSLLHARDYGQELGWSLQLSAWSAGLALLLALVLVLLLPSGRASLGALGLLGAMLALPGPLVTLCVLQGFSNALPERWGFLADQTLLAPILALQFRCLPMVYGLLWLAKCDFEQRMGGTLQLERSLPWWVRVSVLLRYLRSSILTATCLAFMIAFGDLATYLLLQPPGVTTVAMRMFDMLHYGIRNREASLACVLALAAAGPSVWMARRLQRAFQDASHR